MTKRSIEAVIRVSEGRYIRRNVYGVFTTTEQAGMACHFEMTPSLLQCLRDWRERYGIPWSLEAVGAGVLPARACLRKIAPKCQRELPADVRTEADWGAFAEWMLDFVGLGFHPDSDITDYINLDTERKVFDPEFAHLVLQPMLERAFAALSEDRVYEIACDAMMRRYPEMGADCR